jgi:hypothetical protein
MTIDVASLVSEHLDVWTTATERKSGAGRGGGRRVDLYGIDRLRPLIIDFAVRGKLTTQQPYLGLRSGVSMLDAKIAIARFRSL